MPALLQAVTALGQKSRASLTGTITLVQERRFQLVDLRGAAHLFTLTSGASFDPAALRELSRSGAPVTVTYSDDAEAFSHLAHDIQIDGTPL